MSYKTKPIDYTGCNEIIAEHLKRGEAVLCDVWDDNRVIRPSKSKCCVVSYIRQEENCERYFDAEGISWQFAEPIQTKQRVKKASEIVKWLEDNRYEVTRDGVWRKNVNSVDFTPHMFQYCCKEKDDLWTWHSEWLEDIPYDLGNVKNS